MKTCSNCGVKVRYDDTRCYHCKSEIAPDAGGERRMPAGQDPHPADVREASLRRNMLLAAVIIGSVT